MNNKQIQDLKNRNKKILSAFSKKPENVTKTAFAKSYNISTRTLGRILALNEAVPASKSVKIKTKQSTKQEVTCPSELPEESLLPVGEMVPTKKPEITTAPEVKGDQIISWTVTKDRFISVMLDNGQPLSVESSHSDYDEIIHNLAIGNYDDALNKMSIKHLLSSVKIGGFEVSQNKILFNGKKVNHNMADDILSLFTREEPIEHKLRFFENLMMNPSDHIYEHLWKLIKHSGVIITPEGNVECFKIINSDFTDCYTGKIPNNIGDTVTMRRSEVDDNYNSTCSHGLHVCALQYIKSSGYGSKSGIIVKVLVKPQDFVAIPPDYAFTKARVCSYKVLSVVN